MVVYRSHYDKASGRFCLPSLAYNQRNNVWTTSTGGCIQ